MHKASINLGLNCLTVDEWFDRAWLGQANTKNVS